MDILSIGADYRRCNCIIWKLVIGHMDLALGVGDQLDLGRICLSFHQMCMEDTYILVRVVTRKKVI